MDWMIFTDSFDSSRLPNLRGRVDTVSVGDRICWTKWGTIPLDQKCSMGSVLSQYGHLLFR